MRTDGACCLKSGGLIQTWPWRACRGSFEISGAIPASPDAPACSFPSAAHEGTFAGFGLDRTTLVREASIAGCRLLSDQAVSAVERIAMWPVRMVSFEIQHCGLPKGN